MYLQKGKFILIVCKTFHSIRSFLSQIIRSKEKQPTIIVKTMTRIVQKYSKEKKNRGLLTLKKNSNSIWQDKEFIII